MEIKIETQEGNCIPRIAEHEAIVATQSRKKITVMFVRLTCPVRRNKILKTL